MSTKSGVGQSEPETQEFVRHFIDGIEIKLNTPRMAKRYNNALSFSLPLLKNETNIVDLMLIEGIRVFYPTLYDTIKDNSDAFLGTNLGSYYRSDDRTKKNYEEIINSGLIGLSNAEKEAVKSLLKVLFPRSIDSIFNNTSYGPDWDKTWDSEKRISSKHYFNRYFSYTVPNGDVSDTIVDEFIKCTESETINDISKRFITLIGERNADTLIHKLRMREKNLPPKISGILAIAIARVADKIPNPNSLFSFTNAFSQSAIHISFLLKNIPKGQERLETGEKVIKEATPLMFSIECFSWMRTSKETLENDRLFSEREEGGLKQILLNRIRNTCNKTNIYLEYPNEASRYLSIYANFSKGEANDYVAKTLKDSPQNVINLLKIYLPTAWGMESGLPRKGDFDRNAFNALTFVVDADIVYDALCKVNNGDFNVERYPYMGDDEKSIDENVILQFLYIYKKVKSEGEVTNNVPEDTETTNDEEV